jgi:phenylpropionate dioxygenase-like ring-hydroxylating dioxygenase large terminal subunit
MLTNFWWPLEFSTQVTTKPKRVRALGQDLVVYRPTEGGQAQVLSDLCVHRGGALSDGWVEGGCIVCPYHGWEYKSNGECVKIPANPRDAPISRKARVESYPTDEKYGFVWAFLGDIPKNERLPIPEIPIGNTPDAKRLEGDFTWNAYYERVMENGLDFAHAPFVHGSSFGNRKEPEVPEFTVEETPWGARGEATLKPPPARGLWKFLYRKERPGVRSRVGFYLPCVSTLEVFLPMGTMMLIDANIPIDDKMTLTKWVSLRTFFKGDWADNDTRKRVMKIFLQDQPIVEAQRPELLPYDIASEVHVKADAVQLAYRRIRKRYAEKGWFLDYASQSAEKRARATVIPSPSRRDPEIAKFFILGDAPRH